MKHFFWFLIGTILFSACAKVVAPTGGGKDVTPPTVVKMSPDHHSLNVNSKTIKISFNEYVELNNPIDNILVSPPFANPLKYSISRKSLILTLPDSLLPNTTYNFLFSNCIKDYTEGNTIPLLHYSFATGDSIDNFCYEGKILNAETLEQEADMLVFLYKNNIDSLPLSKRPDYLTKSQKNGDFKFENIAEGSYKIFALKDINANLLFDLPNEKIAFQNETILSYLNDTSSVVSHADSTNIPLLFSFVEKDTTQALFKYTNPKIGEYHFPYKNSFDNFQEYLYLSEPKDYFKIINPTQDTVSFYFKENIGDSLRFVFQSDELRDTILLKPFKEAKKQGRGASKVDEKGLTVKFANLGELYSSPVLSFSFPIQPVDSFPATIVKKMKSGNDTVLQYFHVDNYPAFSIPLPFNYEEKNVYSILIRDSLFYNYFGLTNDSLALNFTVKSKKDYGNIIMNYTFPETKTQFIAILMNGNGAIVQKHFLKESQQVVYSHLTPGTYKIKVIFDDNGNGKWDSGNYRKKMQPEKVLFFKDAITVREFWDIEEEFNLAQ